MLRHPPMSIRPAVPPLLIFLIIEEIHPDANIKHTSYTGIS